MATPIKIGPCAGAGMACYLPDVGQGARSRVGLPIRDEELPATKRKDLMAGYQRIVDAASAGELKSGNGMLKFAEGRLRELQRAEELARRKRIPGLHSCRVGTQADIVVLRGRSIPTVGRTIYFRRDGKAAGAWERGVVCEVDAEGYFSINLA